MPIITREERDGWLTCARDRVSSGERRGLTGP